MTMYPQGIGPIPEETRRIAQAACPKGTPAMRLRDALGALYEDEQFVTLYPEEGQPASAPWRLAVVTVLQYTENLTDRQAANAVRERIDWKYALGLELSDTGFDYSLLSAFRTRLVEKQAETLRLGSAALRVQAARVAGARRQATNRLDACVSASAFAFESGMCGRNAACGSG
jgi:transposase